MNATTAIRVPRAAISSVLSVCTSHIRDSTFEMLAERSQQLIDSICYYPLEESGFLIHVTSDGAMPGLISMLGYPDLGRLYRLAQERQCQWLRLEPDAYEIAGLEIYSS